MIGKFVIVRCRDAGVHCGILKSVHGRQVELTDARRIWRWSGANTLNEVSLRGSSGDTRIAEPVDDICLLEACEVIPCTKEGEKNLRRSRWSE